MHDCDTAKVQKDGWNTCWFCKWSQRHTRTQGKKSKFTLRADDYANSGVAKLPGHPHQRIDEGGSFVEVLLEEERQQITPKKQTTDEKPCGLHPQPGLFPC